MKKRGMFFKQKMAALLALSMAVSSIPTGGLFTAVAAEREEQGGAELIRFDREKLREKAEKAAESKKMAAPPAVVASSSYALDFQSDSYELKDAGSLLEEGETLPEDTKLRIFLSPDEAGYEETEDGEIEYAMTGNESLVFMVENESDETRGYQLLFGNQITDVVTVKSKSQLLKEYEAGFEEETATPSNAEETEAVKETLPAVTEETEAVKETLPAIPEETEAQPAESQEEAAGAPEETESAPETEPAESQEEEAQEPAESQEAIEIEMEDGAKEDHDSSVHLLGSLGRFLTGSIVAQAQELPATPSTAQPETGAAEEAQDKPQETTEAAEDATQETAPPASEAQDASPSDAVMEENPEAERYIRLDRAVISDSVLIYSRQEKVDAPDEIKPMMLMNMDRTETEQAKPKKSNTRAVALVTVPYQDIFAGLGQEDGTGDIRVNLYDYSGNGTDNQRINNYLRQKGLKDKEGNYFGFGLGGSDQAAINSYYNNYNGKKVQNIYQGIPEAVDGQDKMNGCLFPDKQTGISSEAVKVYTNVDTKDFFQYEPAENSYSYDSSENGASFNEWENSLSKTGGSGFWPFGNNNYFFGMTMEFDFYKPADGKINDKPMVFSFSGDDDVWVYLKKQGSNDRHLVLDIGGNHGRMDGSINFSTGEIIYSNQNAKPSDGDSNRERRQNVIANPSDNEGKFETVRDSEGTYSVYKTSIDAACPELGFSKDEAQVYTLEFYYLERGGNQSNCKLDFNLPVVPKQGIKISKQLAGTKLTDEIKNKEYQFQIVSSESVDELKKYQAGDRADVDVLSDYTIKGAGSLSIKDAVEADQYFYIQEENPGTNTVFWNVSSSAAGTEPVRGTEAGNRDDYYYSAIYKMPDNEDSGFLFTCTNQFGELNPQIAKRAWLDESTNDGTYDITLEVRGDEMEGTTSEGGNGAVDVVVAADKSDSLYGSFGDIRKAIVKLGTSLSSDSKLYLLGFASEPAKGTRGVPSYDSEEAKEYYYKTVFEWLLMDANGKESLPAKVEKYGPLSGSTSGDGDTHGAAGFVGAKFALDDLQDSSNKKVVIYLTDGKPDCYVENGVLQGTSEGAPKAIAAVKQTFESLKRAYPSAEVYTIGFKEAAVDGDWLDPTNPDGIQVNKYYSAYDYDGLLEAIGDISHEITSTTKVQNPVVTDTLSDAVELKEVQVGDGRYPIPELYIKDGTVAGAADDQGTKLAVSTQDGNTFSYTYQNSDNVIAQYDLDSRTITWYPGKTAGEASDEMGKEDIRTLSFAARAVGTYHAEASQYPDTGEDGTGTHAGDKGYYSNGTAELVFEGGQKNFPKPVVRPVQQTALFELKKEVKGNLPNWEFDFEVGFSQQIDGLGNPTRTENDWYYYTVTLKDETPRISVEVPIGTEYTVSEEDWIDDNYKLMETKWEVNDSEWGSEEPLSGTVGAAGVSVTCINTIGQYQYITVEKKVENEGDNAPNGVNYSFVVKDAEGNEITPFKLMEDGKQIVQIDPEYNEPFKIEETNTQGAWKTESVIQNSGSASKGDAVISNVQSGDTVIFTNYFYDHDIVLGKEVEGENPAASQSYSFTVKLKTEDNATLEQDDIAVVKEGEVSPIQIGNFGPVVDDSDYDYQFTVSLNAGEFIRVNNLPQSVVGYEITENLEEISVDGYDVKVEKIEIDNSNGTDDTTLADDSKAEVNYTSDLEDKEHKITFTNKYTTKLGMFQIRKELKDDIPAEEDVSFIFKVTDEKTPNNSFYVTVKVEKGKASGESRIIEVPVGNYTVEEVDSSLRYEIANEDKRIQKVTVVPEDGTDDAASVTFTNQKTGGGYFTDASSVTNTVGQNGFEKSNDKIQSMESALSKAGPFKKPEPVGEDEDGAEE